MRELLPQETGPGPSVPWLTPHHPWGLGGSLGSLCLSGR